MSDPGFDKEVIEAALGVARAQGRRVESAEVLADRANLVVRLRPADVVARVATTTAFARGAVAARAHMAREVALGGWLAARGVHVVAPLGDAGPSVTGRGFVVSLWEWVDGATPVVAPADAALVASELARLHAALAGYEPSELPVLGPLAEVPTFVARAAAAGRLGAADAAFLYAAHERLDASLRRDAATFRPLHGDAHGGNLLRSGRGVLWTDLEDACLGPPEWDLACLLRRVDPAERPAVLAAYGGDVDAARLGRCLEARTLQGVAWLGMLALRRAEDVPRAEAALAAFRATSSSPGG